MKLCTACKGHKAESEFSFNRGQLRARCKRCSSKAAKLKVRGKKGLALERSLIAKFLINNLLPDSKKPIVLKGYFEDGIRHFSIQSFPQKGGYSILQFNTEVGEGAWFLYNDFNALVRLFQRLGIRTFQILEGIGYFPASKKFYDRRLNNSSVEVEEILIKYVGGLTDFDKLDKKFKIDARLIEFVSKRDGWDELKAQREKEIQDKVQKLKAERPYGESV